MIQKIYLLRDKVALSYVRAFDAQNDGVAVRYIVDVYGKQPHYSDLELWRTEVGYNIETGAIEQGERACVALPPAPSTAPVDTMLSKE
mgnify:CR=1 FL=1